MLCLMGTVICLPLRLSMTVIVSDLEEEEEEEEEGGEEEDLAVEEPLRGEMQQRQREGWREAQ